MTEPIEVPITLRERNQLTLPDRIASRLSVAAGDRLLISLEEGANQATLRPLPASYAGMFTGMYGETAEERAAYIAEERASWDRPAVTSGHASDGTPYLSYEESKRIYWQTDVTRERYERDPKLRWPKCEVCGRSIARMKDHLAAHRAGRIGSDGINKDPRQAERSRQRVAKWRKTVARKHRPAAVKG